ncbi:cytochrome c3 family protein [Aestuariivivens marinum]|uniref:cytochrome c3 family protein n=1 Tax=Aestuariivivens marinum TaxID=2913555 RepID=UPI001F59AF74|nr:cytochrome c3 family protein [Aestuariivivens marinum]
MKHIYKRLYIILGFVFFMMVLTSCKHGEGEYHSINDKIEAESKHYLGVTVSSEDHIGDIKTIQITEGEHMFLIPERKSQIKSYACTECHTKPLYEMQSHDVKKAHWDIDLDHANDNTMNCVTCHNTNNMNDLISITGNTIDFNKSYQLCSQCHSKPFEDWKGGAHGKRIGGWAPPRVSMTCVNCHNPHQPHFESRWPVRFNTQKVKERE